MTNEKSELLTAKQWLQKCRFPRDLSCGTKKRGRLYYSEEQTENVRRCGDNDYFVPLHNKEPILPDVLFYWPEDTERVASNTAWRKEGKKPAPDAQPVKQIHGSKVGWFDVYRESDTVELKSHTEKPAVKLGLDKILHCIVQVNHAAKRQRDAASAQYDADNHGFAGYSSRNKKYYYKLKDKGIRYAIVNGLIHYDRPHGQFAIWRGDNCSFHTLFIKNADLDKATQSEESVIVEAQPARKDLPRLKDAILTLDALPHIPVSEVEALGYTFKPLKPKQHKSTRSPRRNQWYEPDFEGDFWGDDEYF
ncbi:hypothetical protein ACP3V3_19795 [Vibrio sp. PNB22_3_1]